MSVEFVLVGSALLMTAAWRDVATRTIPDSLEPLAPRGRRAGSHYRRSVSLRSFGSDRFALLILLMVVHSRGFIGGGDVKIMTALAVGLSPFDCYRFVIATAIAGGLLGIVYLLLSRRPAAMRESKRASLLGRVVAIEFWRIRRRGSLPYGVAIAAGGAFVLLHSGSF